jgi:hypothetical protein
MVPDTERHEVLLQTLDTAVRQSPWPAWVWCDTLPGGLKLNPAARQWLGLHGEVDQPLMAQALSPPCPGWRPATRTQRTQRAQLAKRATWVPRSGPTAS